MQCNTLFVESVAGRAVSGEDVGGIEGENVAVGTLQGDALPPAEDALAIHI